MEHHVEPDSGLESIYMEITGGMVACLKSNLEDDVARDRTRRREVDGVKVVSIADENKRVQENRLNYTAGGRPRRREVDEVEVICIAVQTVSCHPTESSYSSPEVLTSKETSISNSTWNV